MQRRAVEGFGDPDLRLYTPFAHKTKAEIVKVGSALGVPTKMRGTAMRAASFNAACVEPVTSAKRLSSLLAYSILPNTVSDRMIRGSSEPESESSKPKHNARVWGKALS